MADTYTGKKITEITENTSGADTDLMVVGNRGTAVMRRFTLANLAAYIRDKLTSLTFSALNTSNKTLPGAINELNNKLVDFDITYKIGTITIPDGTSSPTTTQIDITDIKPSGYSSYGAILCLREYQLPYIQSNGSAGTWVTYLNNTRVSITNRAGAWSNYDYYLTVIWKKN